jgi:hypothetical protein
MMQANLEVKIFVIFFATLLAPAFAQYKAKNYCSKKLCSTDKNSACNITGVS